MRQAALVNPALLVWARATINMDVDQAAAHLGITTDRLREWEAGTAKPTVIQARNMARLYKRPLASFYLPAPPGSLGFSVPHDFRRVADPAGTRLSSALVAELRRIQFLREAALGLAEEVPSGAEEVIGTATSDVPADILADRIARMLALPPEARRRWRNSYDAFNGWREAVERRGILVMHLDGVEVTEVRGIAIAERQFPVIAVNGQDVPLARVFTLVHEVAHLMIGQSGLSDLAVGEAPQTPEQNLEAYCNHVAGAVLVPRDSLLAHPIVRSTTGATNWTDEQVEDLARAYWVSREVVMRRLVILGRATPSFYSRKRQQYAEAFAAAQAEDRGGFISPARKALRAVGEPLVRIALSAYYREAITGSDLAEILGTRLKHLSAIELMVEGGRVAAGGNP